MRLILIHTSTFWSGTVLTSYTCWLTPVRPPSRDIHRCTHMHAPPFVCGRQIIHRWYMWGGGNGGGLWHYEWCERVVVGRYIPLPGRGADSVGVRWSPPCAAPLFIAAHDEDNPHRPIHAGGTPLYNVCVLIPGTPHHVWTCVYV